MSRRRRWLKSRRCYEICFRARRGLPFVALRAIKFLLGAILARVQRDDKVILCHDIWNGSHCHLIIVTRDGEQCKRFYGEVQKSITDSIKRLLGLRHLTLWEGNATVAEIADFESAIERISYLYANPAQDNLVESIEQFPGYVSWRDFQRCKTSLTQETKAIFPWVRLPSIQRLNSPKLSLSQDGNLVKVLKERNKGTQHELVRRPNEWMRCFGINQDSDVSEANDKIIKRLRDRESRAREDREAAGKKVLGAGKLLSTPIMMDHEPKKHSRKIFLLSTINELRIQMIKDFKSFCDECRECYLSWRKGDFTVEWPPGAFKPPMPPSSNLLPAW
jgi:hypothetical protein